MLRPRKYFALKKVRFLLSWRKVNVNNKLSIIKTLEKNKNELVDWATKTFDQYFYNGGYNDIQL